ncbi:uncharacterized protein [Heterodontus francisci]|uniref:uncharacterized protein n=1 Tax=Heterodontus francisci TaxID=7792 RepID=UPI00355C781D
MSIGLMLSFSVFLFQSVLAHKDSIYFLDNTGDFILNGSVNPGNSPVIWEWKPHSGQQTTKQLGIFHRDDTGWKVQWSKEHNDTQSIYDKVQQVNGNLRITRPGFELAGLFSCRQTQLSNTILQEYELFGIKVETDSQRPVMGSDITLSCTISRLSDTVSLHWKPRDSSQQNRRNNTDEIHLNNTVYLIVRNIGVDYVNLYTCEVQENGTTVITGNRMVHPARNYFYQTAYTCYRSSTVHSELHLISNFHYFWRYRHKAWIWKPHFSPNQEKQIASFIRFPLIDLNGTYFGNRIMHSTIYSYRRYTAVHIVPVLFDDAGDYTLTVNSEKLVTIKLITVKVTTELSDAVTEGCVPVTLTCSVSDVTESMRLVWINSDGKTVEEKTFNGWNGEEKSLRLIIQKADRGKGNWICALLYQNRPKVLVPYYLEITKDSVYFLDNTSDLILNGSVNPGNSPVIWEWKPHSGQQTTKQLGIFHRDGTGWKVQWSKEHNDTQSIYDKVDQVNGTHNLRITKPGFELAGLFSCRQTQPNKTILKEYEVFAIKVRPFLDTWILALSAYLFVKLSVAIGLICYLRGLSRISNCRNLHEVTGNETSDS